jgi:transcriptional regulator with XRE-family HTH domain
MTMSAEAAGAYLWELRKRAKLSRDAVAQRLETSRSQIERIEGGDGETRSSLLLGFTELVGGDVNHVASLFLNEKMKATDGKDLAQWYAEQDGRQRLARATARRISPENIHNVAQRLRNINETQKLGLLDKMASGNFLSLLLDALSRVEPSNPKLSDRDLAVGLVIISDITDRLIKIAQDRLSLYSEIEAIDPDIRNRIHDLEQTEEGRLALIEAAKRYLEKNQ